MAYIDEYGQEVIPPPSVVRQGIGGDDTGYSAPMPAPTPVVEAPIPPAPKPVAEARVPTTITPPPDDTGFSGAPADYPIKITPKGGRGLRHGIGDEGPLPDHEPPERISNAAYEDLNNKDPTLGAAVKEVTKSGINVGIRGVTPATLGNLIKLQSGGDPHFYDGETGKTGYTGLTSEQAATVDPDKTFDLKNPVQNLYLGMAYLNHLYRTYGTGSKNAIAAFFGGEDLVNQMLARPDAQQALVAQSRTPNLFKLIDGWYGRNVPDKLEPGGGPGTSAPIPGAVQAEAAVPPAPPGAAYADLPPARGSLAPGTGTASIPMDRGAEAPVPIAPGDYGAAGLEPIPQTFTDPMTGAVMQRPPGAPPTSIGAGPALAAAGRFIRDVYTPAPPSMPAGAPMTTDPSATFVPSAAPPTTAVVTPPPPPTTEAGALPAPSTAAPTPAAAPAAPPPAVVDAARRAGQRVGAAAAAAAPRPAEEPSEADRLNREEFQRHQPGAIQPPPAATAAPGAVAPPGFTVYNGNLYNGTVRPEHLVGPAPPGTPNTPPVAQPGLTGQTAPTTGAAVPPATPSGGQPIATANSAPTSGAPAGALQPPGAPAVAPGPGPTTRLTGTPNAITLPGALMAARQGGPNGVLQYVVTSMPRGMNMNNGMEALQNVVDRLGLINPQHIGAYQAWMNQVKFQGMQENLQAAYGALGGADGQSRDPVAAIRYLARSKAFMVDGSDVQFGAYSDGRVFAQRYNAETHQLMGPPMEITPALLRAQVNRFQTPKDFLAVEHQERVANETSVHNQIGERQKDEELTSQRQIREAEINARAQQAAAAAEQKFQQHQEDVLTRLYGTDARIAAAAALKAQSQSLTGQAKTAAIDAEATKLFGPEAQAYKNGDGETDFNQAQTARAAAFFKAFRANPLGGTEENAVTAADKARALVEKPAPGMTPRMRLAAVQGPNGTIDFEVRERMANGEEVRRALLPAQSLKGMGLPDVENVLAQNRGRPVGPAANTPLTPPTRPNIATARPSMAPPQQFALPPLVVPQRERPQPRF